MELPIEFLSRMRMLLGADADAFFQSFQQPKAYGLRINPLKSGKHFSEKDLPFTLTPVSWAKEGFYAVLEEHPGKHPLHEGGAYYIQEPSAMSVVSLLQPEPGDKVCDLCAAPGGKSTQIAGRLLGKGLLVSNEIFPARAKILSQNLERFGVSNCVVCNEPPDRLAAHFPLFFDKIVVDAPCSGEGMFRKDDVAIQEWSPEQVAVCQERQKMILEAADQMLLPDGVMVYSTCTFAPDEDEAIIDWFLHTHPDYTLEDWRCFLPADCGLEGGRADFLGNMATDTDMDKTLRLWPHKLKGEGHFAARLRKNSSTSHSIADTTKKSPISKKKPGKEKIDILDYQNFAKNFIKKTSTAKSNTLDRLFSQNAKYQYFGDELYLVPEQMNSLQGLKIVRAGLHLGTRRKKRFEPAHALAMALQPDEVLQTAICSKEDALRYLHGESISCDTAFKGWTLVCFQGISLGWGKAQNGVLKNHYPKGLRKSVI